MEKQQKELLDWLDEQEGEIMRPVKLSGHPPTKYHLEKQAIIDALRRLVKQFYGEWQGEAQYLLSFSGGTHMDHDGYGRAANLLAKIRNFDPMAAEDKEKIKVEVR